MGLGILSKSSADRSVSMFSRWKRSKSVFSSTEVEKNLPNPKPNNYKIIDSIQFLKGYTVLKIKYLDCTNFEGMKILVFRSTLRKILQQKLIDPHFSDNKKFISPIARFEPTKEGWNMACELVRKILK